MLCKVLPNFYGLKHDNGNKILQRNTLHHAKYYGWMLKVIGNVKSFTFHDYVTEKWMDRSETVEQEQELG